MTTILIDCKKKIVYADRRQSTIYKNSLECEFYEDAASKIHVRNKEVIVGAGDAIDISSFVKRVSEDCSPERPKTFGSTVFIVKNHYDGLDITMYKSEKGFLANKWVMTKNLVIDTFVTVGSGANYAHGAFEICRDGEMAIKVASKYDKYTGCEVDKHEF